MICETKMEVFKIDTGSVKIIAYNNFLYVKQKLLAKNNIGWQCAQKKKFDFLVLETDCNEVLNILK